MKIVDPASLVPYEVLPFTSEEAELIVAGRNAGRALVSIAPMTQEQQEKFLHYQAIDRADEAWLRANLPVGAVFDVLGVTHMVVAIGR